MCLQMPIKGSMSRHALCGLSGWPRAFKSNTAGPGFCNTRGGTTFHERKTDESLNKYFT